MTPILHGKAGLLYAKRLLPLDGSFRGRACFLITITFLRFALLLLQFMVHSCRFEEIELDKGC